MVCAFASLEGGLMKHAGKKARIVKHLKDGSAEGRLRGNGSVL